MSVIPEVLVSSTISVTMVTPYVTMVTPNHNMRTVNVSMFTLHVTMVTAACVTMVTMITVTW